MVGIIQYLKEWVLVSDMDDFHCLLFPRGATRLQHPDGSGVRGPDAMGRGGGQPDAPRSHGQQGPPGPPPPSAL